VRQLFCFLFSIQKQQIVGKKIDLFDLFISYIGFNNKFDLYNRLYLSIHINIQAINGTRAFTYKSLMLIAPCAQPIH